MVRPLHPKVPRRPLARRHLPGVSNPEAAEVSEAEEREGKEVESGNESRDSEAEDPQSLCIQDSLSPGLVPGSVRCQTHKK